MQHIRITWTKIMQILLRLERQQKDFLKSIRIRILHFLSYSYPLSSLVWN